MIDVLLDAAQVRRWLKVDEDALKHLQDEHNLPHHPVKDIYVYFLWEIMDWIDETNYWRN